VQIAASGVTDTPSGFFFVTLTAPGASVLPFDTALCSHGPDVRCSGAIGCKVDEFAGARWNGAAPKRWSYVRQYLVRYLGLECQVFGTWEWQKRGVLHRHFLIRVEGPVSSVRMRQAVGSLRSSLGFGPQMQVDAITSNAARQIYYCAKYASKTADQIDGHRLIDPATGEIKQARGFRPWSCSRRWGLTMKQIRERQRAYVAGSAPARAPGAGGALDTHSQISTDGTPSVVVLGLSDQFSALV
jgi:hypothetical protein